jgi:hypothetical protein
MPGRVVARQSTSEGSHQALLCNRGRGRVPSRLVCRNPLDAGMNVAPVYPAVRPGSVCQHHHVAPRPADHPAWALVRWSVVAPLRPVQKSPLLIGAESWLPAAISTVKFAVPRTIRIANTGVVTGLTTLTGWTAFARDRRMRRSAIRAPSRCRLPWLISLSVRDVTAAVIWN